MGALSLSTPSNFLPPIRQIQQASEDQITDALKRLQAIYCPLRVTTALLKRKELKHEPADSGYASADEVTLEEAKDDQSCIETLRFDEYERSYVVRWLTSLISRATELPIGENGQDYIIEEASSILCSFSDDSNDHEDEALTREFTFRTSESHDEGSAIKVWINDAPLSGTDHTDVGLQSWGASIVFSQMLCSSPATYGFCKSSEARSIIELGAGTGLISLTLAKLLTLDDPSSTSVCATDYHSAVLENLEANIITNFGDARGSISTMLLDWASPPTHLASTADLLFAADVVYAPEHAIWLRECAVHLLKPSGTFWLVVTIRTTGKFQGIPETAEAAFQDGVCPYNAMGQTLRIVEKTRLEKQKGIGRGDESGYMLFKIGWTN